MSSPVGQVRAGDRKSTRLNSSHRCISYAVFCLKKKIIKDGADLARGSGRLLQSATAVVKISIAHSARAHALCRILRPPRSTPNVLFFLNQPATPDISTLSQQDPLPF